MNIKTNTAKKTKSNPKPKIGVSERGAAIINESASDPMVPFYIKQSTLSRIRDYQSTGEDLSGAIERIFKMKALSYENRTALEILSNYRNLNDKDIVCTINRIIASYNNNIDKIKGIQEKYDKVLAAMKSLIGAL